MCAARKVTKHDLEILSDLIFDSYVEQEFDILDYHFVLRSLTTKEREDISRRYRHLSSKYNIKIILEMLTYSIQYINGLTFDRIKHGYFVYRFNSKLLLKIYEEYRKLDTIVEESSKFIDYYIESKESRNMWSVFKTCSRIQDTFSIRNLNQYQYYWIIMNVLKDSLEDEKKSWSKVEYMTNAICAFINPKAFKKAKSQMGIVEQLEQQEDKTKQHIVEELETGKKQVVIETNDVFSSMERQNEESDEDYEYRVNILMEKTLKGELVDEHDRLVRESEIKFLKKFLREKRIQVLVEREIHARRGITFDSTEALENEALRIQLEEDKEKGFFHDDFSYLEIIKMKDFAAVSIKEKQQAFEEVMSEEIDIETEVNHFLKSLSGQDSNVEGEENKEKTDELSSMVNLNDDASETRTDSECEEEPLNKSSAEKAANMSVDIKSVDLLKQRQERLRRATRALDIRNKVLKLEQPKKEEQDNSNLDVMKFDID